MKNLFSLLSFSAATLLFVGCSSGPSDAERKKNFTDVCVTSAQESFGNTVDKKLVEDYCACSYEKLTSGMSTSEQDLLDKDPNDPALAAKAESLTKPCLDEFVQKASSQMGQ